jgi:hypothetical protein
LNDLDAFTRDARQVGPHLFRTTLTHHEPEEGRRKDVTGLTVDQHYLVLFAEALTQFPGGDKSADSSAKNRDRRHISVFPSST